MTRNPRKQGQSRHPQGLYMTSESCFQGTEGASGGTTPSICNSWTEVLNFCKDRSSISALPYIVIYGCFLQLPGWRLLVQSPVDYCFTSPFLLLSWFVSHSFSGRIYSLRIGCAAFPKKLEYECIKKEGEALSAFAA